MLTTAALKMPRMTTKLSIVILIMATQVLIMARHMIQASDETAAAMTQPTNTILKAATERNMENNMVSQLGTDGVRMNNDRSDEADDIEN